VSDGDGARSAEGAIELAWGRGHRAEGALTDDDLAEMYAVADRSAPWLRVNFVSSLDGAATVGGLSGGLSGPADRRVFDLLRRLCDVVIVGAGTVRGEGYGAMRLDDAQTAWRRAQGLAEHPRFALVSGRLDLDPSSTVFTDAPVRPIVITAQNAPADRKRQLSAVADVIECGDLTQQHCEGGPHLFGSLVSEGAADELCLTQSPLLVAGHGPRISGGSAPEVSREFALEHVLRSDDALFFRYVRSAS
jgi:riboflavin biosynthesis pyrimidine reductase